MNKLTFASVLVLGCSTTSENVTPTATASVHAYEDGTGAAGRIAVFATTDGDITSIQTTDRNGHASAPVGSAGQVTIANIGAPKFELTTYVDIAPGDEMAVGETEDEGNDGVADVGAVVAALPALPAGMHGEVGVGRSMVAYGDSPPALHLSSQFYARASRTAQVLGVARDATGVATAFAIGEASGAGNVTLPGWRTDWDQVAFSLSSVPSATTVQAHADLLQGNGRFHLDPISPTAKDFTLQMPRGLGDGLDYSVVLTNGTGSRSIRERSTLRHDITVDTSTLLPAITSAMVRTSADGRPEVAWTVAGASRGDFVMIRLSWGADAHRWTIVLPPSHANHVQLPALPDSLASWRPTGEDLEVSVALVDRSDLASYHDAMKRGVEELDELYAPGSVLISQLGGLEE